MKYWRKVVRKLLVSVSVLLVLYGCGGGGGLGDPNVHYRNFDIDIGIPKSTYLTSGNHEKGWEKSDCLSCHQIKKHTAGTYDVSVEEYQSLIKAAVESVGEKNAIEVCSACHGTNGLNGVQRKCLVCHDQMAKVHFYSNSSSREHFHDFNGNGKLDDFDCVVCHWQPDMDGIVEFDTDLARLGGTSSLSTSEFCLKCHSNGWLTLKDQPLADVNGDGNPEVRVSTNATPSDIATSWVSDFHGGGSYGSSADFKDVSLDSEELFYASHEPLECVQCHNPHASKNDKLIVETVGETLTIVKRVEQNGHGKFALVDPRTYRFFGSMEYSGIVYGENETYDLSNGSDLSAYTRLPVFNDDGNVTVNRETVPTLCASCHDGSSSYASNGLGLPIDVNGHYNGTCVSCHSHGELNF